MKTWPGNVKCEIDVPLAEASLENMQIVFGAGSIVTLPNGNRRLTFGGRETVTYVPVMIIMPGPTGMKQVAVFYRSNVGFGGAVSIGKDSNRDVPMKVTVLCDTSRALGDQLGYFEEYTPA